MSVRRLWPLLAAMLLAACAAAPPPPEAAPPPLPAQWRLGGEGAGDAVSRDWWRGFGSEQLAALVARAEAQSLDVAAAAARVRQAEAVARMAGAALQPGLAAGVDASREGGRAGTGATRYAAGLRASYEVDLWGRLRAQHDGALQALRASAFDREAVRLGVTAAVASAWLQAAALHERIGLAERQWRDAQRLLALVESRARAGAASPLELAQQRGLVASQARQLAALRQQAGDARTALAVLTGQAGEVALQPVPLAALRVPATQAGVPSALLVRRPDLARAEARLRAADADVQAARAAMLPSLTLGAGLGTGGTRLPHLVDHPLYSVAAALAAPIFDAGRLAAGRDLAQARREELLADYRAAIVAAWADVEAALDAAAGADAQRAALADELAQARRALALAESRYRAGAETLLVLLDAQRVLNAAQDAELQLLLARLQAGVALFRALGGGWCECG